MTGTIRIYTAAKATYAVFGVIWAVPAVILFLGLAKIPWQTSSLEGILIVFFEGAVFYAWVSAFRLEISQDELHYRSLFRGSVRVNLSDIRTARMASGREKWLEPFLPPIRVEVRTRPGISPDKFHINAKVFEWSAVTDLRNTLSHAWRK